MESVIFLLVLFFKYFPIQLQITLAFFLQNDLYSSVNTIRISFFRAIPSDKSLFLTLETTGCAGTETEVNYLEHVQALITLNTTRRGDVELFLRSPMGTRSMILSTRPNDDDSRDGFTKWPFMTTHTWAEYPRGKWTLEVYFSCQT